MVGRNNKARNKRKRTGRYNFRHNKKNKGKGKEEEEEEEYDYESYEEELEPGLEVSDQSLSFLVGEEEYVLPDQEEQKAVEKVLAVQAASLPRKLKKEFVLIQQDIQSEEPKLEKILSANITQEDKKYCLYLYMRFLNTDLHTENYLSLLQEINQIVDRGNKFTAGDLAIIEKKELTIRQLSNPDEDLKTQILNMEVDDKVIAIVYLQYLEMLKHEPTTSTYASLREEIEWSVRLPHRRTIGHSLFQHLSKMNTAQLGQYYSSVLNQLDQELYGMQNVKQRLIHMLNDRRTSGFSSGRNIALKGPPGTGKTSIGKSLAKVLGLPFEKISVGGLEDATVLKGSDRVWNSAAPSIVLQILARLKYSDVIIMFDEVDKLGHTAKGREVIYALLHISDYSHNSEFRDNYLNKYTHDLSRIWFIFCMNDDSDDLLDSAFKDRLDIIEVTDYTEVEQRTIIQDYLLPRALEGVGLPLKSLTLSKTAVDHIMVMIATKDSTGMRQAEKIIKELVGKINMYLSVVLDDGTTGDLDLGYTLQSTKFPIKLSKKSIKQILDN